MASEDTVSGSDTAVIGARTDPDRARSLAEAAREEVRGAPGMGREASEVDAWLASRAAPR